MESKDGLDSELESFRQQWLSDLHFRNAAQGPQERKPPTGPSSSLRSPAKPTKSTAKTEGKKVGRVDDDEEYVQARSFDEPAGVVTSFKLAEGQSSKTGAKELISALDHYEAAVEKETAGNLGDSLQLYRKAFRVRYGFKSYISPDLLTVSTDRQSRRPAIPEEALSVASPKGIELNHASNSCG
jgi:F-box protein 9